MTCETDEVQAAVEGEMRLLKPAVRLSRDLVEGLLDPDFIEVGSSGRRWDRQGMLDELPTMPGAHADQQIEVVGMHGVSMAPGLVHLTYETVLAGRRVRRCSLWRKDKSAEEWRLFYHQGTLV
jgi:hypothetical protein